MRENNRSVFDNHLRYVHNNIAKYCKLSILKFLEYMHKLLSLFNISLLP